jgi:glycosyltransferase involved in cell wall biosynthesis
VYNPKLEMFRLAVGSVLAQTFPVLELVLVNDGGSEEFRSVLPEDERIRVFTKQNEGVAAARNFAIEHCCGEYIAFLDQDDYWYEDKLKEQTGIIPVPGEVCMVISPIDIVDSYGSVIIKKNSKRVAERYFRKTARSDIRISLAEGNFIYSSTPIIHHLVFSHVGNFDSFTKPHDDWDMYLRIAIAGIPIHSYREKALSVWRIHDSNESHKIQTMMASKCRVEKKLLKVTGDKRLCAILKTNLLLDYVDRDNILFKLGRYRIYRALLRRHLVELLYDSSNYRVDNRYLYQGFLKNVRKAIVKSLRRYFVSFFYEINKVIKKS